MISLITHLPILLGASLLVLYPAAPLLNLLGFRGRVPAPLLFPCAVAINLAVLTAPLALTLALKIPHEFLFSVWAGSSLLLTALAWRQQSRNSETGWLTNLVDATPFGWLKTITPDLRWISLFASLLTYIVGGWLTDGDMLYHTALALKLQQLDAPGFASTQLFVDGSVHPGYLVPVWHELVALVSTALTVEPVTTMWVIAAPMAAISTLAFGGLGLVMFRSQIAGVVAATAFVLINGLSRIPNLGSLAGAASPSAVVINLIFPLAIALWAISIWHNDERTRFLSRRVLSIAVVIAIGATHVSYLVWLAMLITGYLVVWLLRGPWKREIIMLTFGVSLRVMAVSVIVIATLYPVLALLSTVPGEGSTSAVRSEFNDFAAIMVGEWPHYRLRADMLVQFGGLALIGGLALPLATRRLDEPVSWFMLGSGSLALAFSQHTTLYPVISQILSISQSKRILYAFPYVLGFTMLILLVSSIVGGLLASGKRAAAYFVLVLTAAATSVATFRYPSVVSAKSAGFIPEWTIRALSVVMIACLAVVLLARFERARRDRRMKKSRGSDRGISSGPDLSTPVVALGQSGTRAAAMLLTLIAIAPAARATPAVYDKLAHRPRSAEQAWSLSKLDPKIIDEVRRMPAGSIVLSPIKASLRIQALAPVYSVAVPRSHVAGTRKNRRIERRTLNENFYRSTTPGEERIDVAHDVGADFIVVHNIRKSPILRALDAPESGFKRAVTGDELVLYRSVTR